MLSIFSCTCWPWVPSLEKCPLFPLLSFNQIHFSLLSWVSSLNILSIHFLFSIWFANIFSHSILVLFYILLIVSFLLIGLFILFCCYAEAFLVYCGEPLIFVCFLFLNIKKSSARLVSRSFVCMFCSRGFTKHIRSLQKLKIDHFMTWKSHFYIYIQWKWETGYWKDICTSVFIATVFVVTKIWEKT